MGIVFGVYRNWIWEFGDLKSDTPILWGSIWPNTIISNPIFIFFPRFHRIWVPNLFDLIAVPLSLLLHFIPLSLSLLCPPIWAVLHHLYMYMVAFLALRTLYVIALVCFVFVPCSPPESLPGKDVLCRLLPRPLPSVCFLFFSFLFRPCSPPICFW